jgi:hypothetical protein
VVIIVPGVTGVQAGVACKGRELEAVAVFAFKERLDPTTQQEN